MRGTYKGIVWGSALVAGAAALIYATTLIVAGADGPTGYEVSGRAGAIAVSIVVLGVILAMVGWMIRAAHKESAAKIAAEVSYALVNVLDQRLTRVADRTADRSHDNLVEVMRELTEGLRADFVNYLERAETRGKILEADEQRRRGSVTSINGRRDT